MEKTIEERADAKAEECYPYRGGVKGMICDTNKIPFKQGYIVGATEQKAIDDVEKQELIDKACKWLMEHTTGDVECNEKCEPLAKSYIESQMIAMEIVESFKQAMEE